MNKARIICSHEAEPFARKLAQLMGETGRQVEVCVGRAYESLAATANERREVVVLIWTRASVTQHYMRLWLTALPPEHLVEICFTRSLPPSEERRHYPLDFSSWTEKRSHSSWIAFEGRLRNAERAISPPAQQPVRAASVLGMAGLGIVVTAMGARYAHDAAPLPQLLPNADEAIAQTFEQTRTASVETTVTAVSSGPLGGPLDVVEPNSSNGMRFDSAPRIRSIEGARITLSGPVELLEPINYRDPTLFNRLADIAQSGLREFGGEGED